MGYLERAGLGRDRGVALTVFNGRLMDWGF